MSLSDLLAYGWLWVKPSEDRKVMPNKMYDRIDLVQLRKISFKLAQRDPAWFPRLFEPTTLGIRTWEYGVMLKHVSFRGKTVLDVGPGNSRLPKNLSKMGAKVTMLDMDEPLEKTEIKKDKNLRFVLGDMTKISFKDNLFDRVICISAIEHVDMKSGGKFFDLSEYLNRALQAIREMARVTKKGGVFDLTTDFYLPEQKTDKWSESTDKIHGAFPWTYIDKFAEEIEKSGIKLNSKVESDEEILRGNTNKAIYRGRYFTTVAFMGSKTDKQ